MSTDTESETGRIWLIDVARFYAMSLVFYGHFIEELIPLNNPAAAGIYKFISARARSRSAIKSSASSMPTE